MTIDLFPSRPKSPTQMLATFANLLHAKNSDRLRAGFAYATVGGVHELVSTLNQSPDWEKIRKQFIIGIGQGISEPYALTKLSLLPNSEVKVFLPNKALTKAALYDPPTFHGKIFACGRGDVADFIIASSANLTTAAVGQAPRNYEFGIGIVSDDLAEPLDRHNLFNPWWSDAWQHSREVNQEFINNYAELRKRFLQKNPVLLSVPEPPTTISQASEFWIEVGKASGPPQNRHQIEFSESLVEFFGPIVREKRMLVLQRKKCRWDDRPLSHKVTTFGVEIWRLGMPTVAKGGYPIQNRIIWFRRTETPLEFEFEVTDIGSKKANQWESKTNLHGHMGQTKGMHPRRYGFA